MEYALQYLLQAALSRLQQSYNSHIVVLETSQEQKKQFCAKGHPNRFRNGREKGVQIDRQIDRQTGRQTEGSGGESRVIIERCAK